MANIKDFAESRGTLLNVDPRNIHVMDDLNARNLATQDNVEHIEWLSKSIATEGVKVPLTVFQQDNKLYVSDGHCRLAATLLAIEGGADIKTVPCIPEARGTNDVDRILSQNVFNSGKQLTPLERGVNFKKAVALGASVAHIAKAVGMSTSYVHQVINFQAAPAEVHAAVANGEISSTLALDLVRERGVEEGAKAVKEAVTAAKAEGKKATAKHVPPKASVVVDEEWGKLVKFVRAHANLRPKGLKNADIKAAMEWLTAEN